jgi:hypothetical protein
MLAHLINMKTKVPAPFVLPRVNEPSDSGKNSGVVCARVKGATEQAPVCLIQIDAELHLSAVLAEKNAVRFQTSYAPLCFETL